MSRSKGNKTYQILVGAVVLPITLFIAACATGPSGPTDKPLYYGYGTAPTVTGALNSAKRQILPLVVADLVGGASVAANRENLETNLYATDALNAYFYLDSMEIISQGRQGDDYYRQIAIRVNLDALARSLRAGGIYGGQITPSTQDELALMDMELISTGAAPSVSSSEPTAVSSNTGTASASPAESGSVASASGDALAGYNKLSPDEREIIERYIRTLSFLVYFDENTDEDPFVIKSAVGMANGFLADMGRSVNDLEQVERLKEEQELVYEEQTGRSVGLIQWIAQKLNADVYVQLDARTTSERSDGRYYGQANLALKFFESSNGALLASVNYKSPRAFSQSSTLDAVNNALQSSVYEAMPVAMDQLETSLRSTSSQGIPFTLILQNTAETRIVRDFARKLETQIGGIETVSQSNENTRYQLYFLGSGDDLIDLIFDVSDGFPAFAGIELVLFRGRELTFDTGM